MSEIDRVIELKDLISRGTYVKENWEELDKLVRNCKEREKLQELVKERIKKIQKDFGTDNPNNKLMGLVSSNLKSLVEESET